MFMVSCFNKWGWLAADPKRRLAQEANDFPFAVALLDQHELAAPRIGTLNGKDHGIYLASAKVIGYLGL